MCISQQEAQRQLQVSQLAAFRTVAKRGECMIWATLRVKMTRCQRTTEHEGSGILFEDGTVIVWCDVWRIGRTLQFVIIVLACASKGKYRRSATIKQQFPISYSIDTVQSQRKETSFRWYKCCRSWEVNQTKEQGKLSYWPIEQWKVRMIARFSLCFQSLGTVSNSLTSWCCSC